MTTNGRQHPEGNEILSIEDVHKSFDEKVILRGISFRIQENETLTILGKSGAGKSVLLKLMVKLLEPTKGRINYRGTYIDEMNEAEILNLRRHIGFLFQGAALFDSMTVGENLDLFLSKHTKLAKEKREEKIQRALEMVGLAEVIDSMPSELSGGMKKRAGLARSIVLEPELILYDEPTTGLDPVTAASIAELILTLQSNLGVASVVVTHDLPTAFTVSDRTIVLHEGEKIYDGHIENLEEVDNPYLKEYLEASTLDRTRREAILRDGIEKKRSVRNSQSTQALANA